MASIEVTFIINNWKIEKEKDTGMPKIVGRYDLLMNGKVIASQDFNQGYNGMAIPFSGDLMHRLQGLEQDLIAEIKKMVG